MSQPSAAAQTAADLRSLVARRVGVKRTVALLGSDQALVRALESNGCVVLADPESIDALRVLAPEVVVAFDGFAQLGDGGENFKRLALAAPKAELVFSFANASSSAALLQALTGQSPPPGIGEPQVRAWLSAAGLHVVSRDVVVGPHQSTGLAVDAEAQLRQLLEQLNPTAGAERLLIVARPGAAEALAIPREPGLLSVIVSAGNEPGLQETLAALAGQPQRPLQILVVTSGPVQQAERLASLQAERGSFAVEVLAHPSPDFAARTNHALPRARGQYLAFLEAGDTVERQHFRQLIRSLEQSVSAWAIALVEQPGVEARHAAFSLPAWLSAGASARCALVVDRARLGPFPLTFAEGVTQAEPLFLARLAAIFPASTVRGVPSVRRPIAAARFEAAALEEAMRARPLRAIGPLRLADEAGWGDRLLPGAATLRRWLKPR